MTKRFGFTLAEVLITLGIIGVVAAMTIPTLMNQTGQAQFRTGFKKIISTLNQAVTMNVALDSSDFASTTSTSTAAPSTDNSIGSLFLNRMSIQGSTTAITTTEQGAAFTGTNYTLFFPDSMRVSFLQAASACTSTSTNCKAIVDVNGLTKPNKLTYCGAANATPTVDATACATDGSDLRIGDQFSIKIFDQQVVPNGQGARAVLYR